MSFGIVRVQKMGAGSVKGIEIHDRREKDGISHTNPDIDWDKSSQNYDLHPKQNDNFGRAVKERINQLDLKKAVRKDAVVMAQVLVTSDHSFFENMTKERQQQFFQDSYKFLAKRYGEKNIVSATVHLDERTPHMHFNFVPATPDGRLSAKDVLTRQSLIEQQTAFQQQVGQNYGLERGLEGGKRRHLEVAEYKERSAKERASMAILEANQAKRQLQQAQTHLDELTPRLLTAEKAAKIAEKGRRTLFGNLKGVSVAEFESLAQTAKQVQDVQKRNDILISATNKMRMQVDDAQEWVSEQKKLLELERKQLTAGKKLLESEMRRTPSKHLQEQNYELQARNRFLEKLLYETRMAFRHFLPEIEKTTVREGLMRVDKAIKAGLESEKEQGFER